MSVHLVHGSDEALVADKVAEIVRELVGDQDRSLVLEEFSGDFVMAGATEAASTPPFFTDRRVIVVRATSGAAPSTVGFRVDSNGYPTLALKGAKVPTVCEVFDDIYCHLFCLYKAPNEELWSNSCYKIACVIHGVYLW